MVYGAIGVGYKSKLVLCEGSIDAAQYRENIIKSEMIQDLNALHGKWNYIFMQDGATCHTAKTTIDWLKTQLKYITKWPANSPDLNPIENLWGCMKKAIHTFQPETLTELKQVVFAVWDNIDQSVIDHLVLSFYQRLQLVIINDGASIQPYLRKELYKQNYICTQPPNQELIINVFSDRQEPVLEESVNPKNSAPFTKEEDKLLISEVLRIGPKYTQIAKKFHNRSAVDLKNRHNLLVDKKSFNIQFNIIEN